MTYAVTWCENDGPVYVGKLDLDADCVQLSGAAGRRATVRRLQPDDVGSVRFERRAGASWAGGRVLVIAGRDGAVLRLTPLQGLGVAHEIADRLEGVRGKAVA